MARWLSFFAVYNFEVKYKPGKQNALADALSHMPDYELSHPTTISLPISGLIRSAYAKDVQAVALLRALKSTKSNFQLLTPLRARLHRFSIDNDLLIYCTDTADPPRVVALHDEHLKHRILYEAHDTVLTGNVGREKTYGFISQSYWWPKPYKMGQHIC